MASLLFLTFTEKRFNFSTAATVAHFNFVIIQQTRCTSLALT